MKTEAFEVSITEPHSLIIPERFAKPFLSEKTNRVKVIATFKNRSVTFHAALQRDKLGIIRVTFGQTLQKELGIFLNDYFKLQFFKDESKYGVDMPEEMEAVLSSDPEAQGIFESFTAGKKRSLIYTIKRYKNSQTKIDKSLILSENLKRGITDQKLLFKA